MAAVKKKVAEELSPEEAVIAARAQMKELDGPEKAAIMLLALGAEYGNPIWSELDDSEVITISLAMSRLGTVTKELTETMLTEFVSQMTLAGALMGTALSTERLLAEYLPPDRLRHIMEEIRGPAGRNMWEKLSNVQANVLANYLKNEYPQTVAVVLSKISTEHAARVLSILPEDFAMEVVQRLLGMESVQREVLEKIEHTLRSEFISNLSQTQKRDAHELMAEVFNNFDRQTETRFLSKLEEVDWDAAERIKHLMFTFDDLTKLDRGSAQTLIRKFDQDKLVLAMKGATEPVREFFFSNMTERTRKLLRDDLEALGPVRLKDVDDAQSAMISLAKDMAAKGDIIISKSGGEDELIY
ncbi:MAG: flagellar motor switch protein FliG [Hyphomicrobiales bacterium]